MIDYKRALIVLVRAAKRRAIKDYNENHDPSTGQFSSGGGSSANGKTSGGGAKLSPLQAFKENARQFNEALIEGKKRNAQVVEYKRIDGKTERRYWNGARYEDRPSQMYQNTNGKYKTEGTYKAEFKMPN